jgi:hypothetical protein
MPLTPNDRKIARELRAEEIGQAVLGIVLWAVFFRWLFS